MTKTQLLKYLECKGVNLDSIVGTGARAINQSGRRNLTKFDLVNVATDLSKRGLDSASGIGGEGAECFGGCPMNIPGAASIPSSDCEWMTREKYGGGEEKELNDRQYLHSKSVSILPEPDVVFERATKWKLKQPCQQLSRTPIYPEEHEYRNNFDRLLETVVGVYPAPPSMRPVAVFKTAHEGDTILAMEVGPSPYLRAIWMECINKFLSKKQPNSVTIVDRALKIRLIRPMQLKSEPWICETENGRSAFAFIHISGDWHLFTAQKALLKRLPDRNSALAVVSKLVEGDSDESIPGSDLMHFAWKEEKGEDDDNDEDNPVSSSSSSSSLYDGGYDKWLSLALIPLPYYFD